MKKFICLLLLGLFFNITHAMQEDLFEEKWHFLNSNATLKSGLFSYSNSDKSIQGLQGMAIALPATELEGCSINISGNVLGDNISVSEDAPYYAGGIALFIGSFEDGKKFYYGYNFPRGSYSWKNFSKNIKIPANLSSLKLLIGLQMGTGTIKIKDFKLKKTGIPIPINSVANMALYDKVAGDGKGGWSDEGPENNGICFQKQLTSKEIQGVPFELQSKDKCIIVLKSPKFTNGLDSVTVPCKKIENFNNIYLLHTVAWGGGDYSLVGDMILNFSDKTSKSYPIKLNQDVTDWWSAIEATTNSLPAITAENQNSTVSLGLSKFAIPKNKIVTSITFKSSGNNPIWIIAGVSASNQELNFNQTAPVAIKEGKDWVIAKRSEYRQITPNSIIDLTPYFDSNPAGTYGRVIVNAQGHLVFEKSPDKVVRFLTTPLSLKVNNKEDADNLVAELKKHGYNMVRTHFLEYFLLKDAPNSSEVTFNPKNIDLFFYLISKLKESGIYLNFDCMTVPNGYSSQSFWDYSKSNKRNIYFDENARKNWLDGVTKILCTVNPYTNTKLVDEPLLVTVQCYNEQEFSFMRDYKVTPDFTAAWQSFLHKRYGTIEKLKSAWKTDDPKISTFKDIPAFRKGDLSKRDVSDFMIQHETELTTWYIKKLQEIGYKGLINNYNMVGSLHYDIMRDKYDSVAINAYHEHPSAWDSNRRSNGSSIGQKGGNFRKIISAKISQKPLLVTEHNHVFWNSYRHEQGLVMGAYAALNGIDALAAHGSSVSMVKNVKMMPFWIYLDPINIGSEFLTFMAYSRGDVSTSSSEIKVVINKEQNYPVSILRTTTPLSQNKFSLITKFSKEFVSKDSKLPQTEEKTIRIPFVEGAKVEVNTAGFSEAVEDSKESSTLDIATLKHQKLIAKDNKSDGINIFESSTGELLLNAAEKSLIVNTPRLQGICGEANFTTKLPNFTIQKLTERGTLALVAMDELKPIAEAQKLVIVYLTNALNEGTVFSNDSYSLRIKDTQSTNIMLKTGQFKVAIKNRYANSLKLYPLDLAGNRQQEIKATSTNNEEAIFEVDTFKTGGCIFFEVTTE